MTTLLALCVGPDIPVDRGLVMVGRHPECDIRLDSLRVSRRHCIITADGDALIVRDLGSTNGTWINGRRVAWGLLRPGDEIMIAHLRYHLGEAPTPLAVAAAGERPGRPEDESDAMNSSDV
jgi:pSer/pThr/pTyr-binding forkhead associated (FHA) protein